MNFGERLKELREDTDLTQETLSNKINVSRSTVAAWESGTNEPSLSMLVILATLFEVSTDYLLGITNVKENIRINKSLETYINDCINIYYKHISIQNKKQ